MMDHVSNIVKVQKTNRAEELRYVILATQREGNRALTNLLRPLGITPAQAEVLAILSDSAPLSLRALGERLICESGSPSRLVATLVDRDLVQRDLDERDGRAFALRLTAAGQRLVSRIRDVERDFAKRFRSLAPADVDRTIRVLRTLIADGDSARALRKRFAGSEQS